MKVQGSCCGTELKWWQNKSPLFRKRQHSVEYLHANRRLSCFGVGPVHGPVSNFAWNKDREVECYSDATELSSNKSSEYNLREQKKVEMPIMNTSLAFFPARKGNLLGCRSCGGILLGLGVFFALVSRAAAGIEATLIAYESQMPYAYFPCFRAYAMPTKATFLPGKSCLSLSLFLAG
jgi:hypothetical protein